MLPFPCVIERTSVLEVPEGMVVGELPGEFSSRCAGVQLSCKFDNSDPSQVMMTKTVRIDDVIIPLDDLQQWNSTVAAWNDTCDRQIELFYK